MKREINVFEYAQSICQALPKGILLTTCCGNEVNTMTIGWGTIGIDWSRPVFIAFVRETRYTKEMLEKNAEFTVNIPYGDVDSNILKICGTKSGRDINKIQELGLTIEEPLHISVPGIQELPLTLECKVIYKQKQDLSALPENILERYYPADQDGFRDYHYAYYAEIVGAYIIEKD